MKRLISLKPRNLSISGICAAQHVNRKIRLGFFHRRFSTASSPSEGKIKPHFLTKTLIYLLNYTFLTIGAGICLFIYPDPREKRMLWSPNPINHLVPQNLAEEDEDDKNYYTCEFLENPLLESILGKGYSIKTGNNNQLSTKVISSGDDHIIDLSRRHDYYLWTGGKQINQRDLPKVTVDERDMALIYSMTFELFNPTNKTNGEIPDWRLEIELSSLLPGKAYRLLTLEDNKTKARFILVDNREETYFTTIASQQTEQQAKEESILMPSQELLIELSRFYYHLHGVARSLWSLSPIYFLFDSKIKITPDKK